MSLKTKNLFYLTNIWPVRYKEVRYRGKIQLGPQNGVHYIEVSAIKCPLHRGFVMRV